MYPGGASAVVEWIFENELPFTGDQMETVYAALEEFYDKNPDYEYSEEDDDDGSMTKFLVYLEARGVDDGIVDALEREWLNY